MEKNLRQGNKNGHWIVTSWEQIEDYPDIREDGIDVDDDECDKYDEDEYPRM